MDYCYLEASAVSDAEDAGAAEDYCCVWAPCYIDVAYTSDYGVTVDSSKGVAASIDSDVYDSDEGPCSSEELSNAFPPHPVILCLLFFGSIVYT